MTHTGINLCIHNLTFWHSNCYWFIVLCILERDIAYGIMPGKWTENTGLDLKVKNIQFEPITYIKLYYVNMHSYLSLYLRVYQDNHMEMTEVFKGNKQTILYLSSAKFSINISHTPPFPQIFHVQLLKMLMPIVNRII